MIARVIQAEPTRARLTEAALHLHDAHGFTVLPVCGKAAVGRWQRWQAETPTPRQIAAMFNRDDITGLAVVLKGGLCVRDFDDAGEYDEWARLNPHPSMSLPTFRTGRGYGVMFQHEGMRHTDLRPHGFEGELRTGAGHYSILPPSVHENGRSYTWTVPLGVEVPHLAGPVAAGLVPVEAAHRGSDTHIAQYGLDVSDGRDASDGPDASAEESVDSIIERTLPSGAGERNRKIFALVCALRGLTEYRNEPASSAREVLRQWHKRASTVIGTKDWSATLSDFNGAWSRYDPAKAGGSLGDAVRAARQASPVENLDADHHERVHLLAKVCRELARRSDDGTFFLGGRAVHRHTGTPAVTAARDIKLLAEEGVIKLVKAHGFDESGRRQSAVYRYILKGD